MNEIKSEQVLYDLYTNHSFFFKSINLPIINIQRINGLVEWKIMENPQETIDFPIKYDDVLYFFS